MRPEVAKGRLPALYAIAAMGRIPRSLERTEKVWASVDILVASAGSSQRRRALRDALGDASSRRPLSKFGLDLAVTVLSPAEFVGAVAQKRAYYYPRRRTWKAVGQVTPAEAVKLGRQLATASRPTIPPILSNVRVSEDPRPIG